MEPNQSQAVGLMPSPIAILSDDILAYMFELEARDPPAPHVGLAFSLVVSSVSSRWRMIALRTPEIWTNIALKDPLRVEWIKLLLNRSGVLPLKIGFCVTKSRMIGPTASPLVTDLEGVGKALLDRCESLTIEVRCHRRGNLLLSPSGASDTRPLPFLKRMSIFGPCSSLNFASFESFIMGCPTLRSLDLHNVYWPPPFTQGLESLSQAIKLVNLRYLGISADSHYTLKWIDTPGLEAVHVTNAHPEERLSRPLLSENFSAVRQLALGLIYAKAQAVFETICGMPCLKTLVSDSMSFPDEEPLVISNLAFPPLENIEFHGALWPKHVLRALVSSTTGTDERRGSLQKVTISLGPNLNFEHWESGQRATEERVAWMSAIVETVILP